MSNSSNRSATSAPPGPPVARAIRRSVDSHTLIKGRRWRRTDPAIDDTLRQHLVDELMDARRAVKAAKAQDDASLLEDARARVYDAKVGLGERGPTWWTSMSPADIELRVEATSRAVGTREPGLDGTQIAVLLGLAP